MAGMKPHKQGLSTKWTGIGGHKCHCCKPAQCDKPKERRSHRRKLKAKDKKEFGE